MHRALIVPSRYAPSTGYLDREGWRHSSRVLGARLKEHGYAVETLEPGPGLVKSLRQALATEDPLSAVVIVFCGYVLLTEAHEPALLLSDENVIALRLEQLCAKAARSFGRVLLVIDGVRGSSTRLVQEANPGTVETSPELLLSRMAAESVRADNSGLLLSLAPWGTPDAIPDHGLCQRLSDILGELDDTQAMSTPELEFTLNSTQDEASKVTCRHSKPAFVFLPARRFDSQPPPGGMPPHAPPVLDRDVDPYRRRDDEDRSAWTPPPDTPVPSREPFRPSPRPSFAPLHLPATGVLPPPPLPALPPIGSPGLGVPPPLPGERPSNTLVPSASVERSAGLEVGVRPLGVPPPLPSERSPGPHASALPPLPVLQVNTEATLPPAPIPPLVTAPAPPLAAPHTSASALIAPPPLPPLPPLPEASVPPPFSAVAPPIPPPLPMAPGIHGFPPPLPVTSSAQQQDALPSVSTAPETANAVSAELATDVLAGDAGPTDEVSRYSTSPAQDSEPANTSELPQANAQDVSNRSGPPPRKRRDSADGEAAPSLPPLAMSPESWRPQSLAHTAPRDEAALLSLANGALSQGQTDVALEHASRCLDSFPESASALQILATILVGERQFQELAQVYERLIGSLGPTMAAQLCAAAARLWHSELRDTSKAREMLERGLELDANNASLRRELADLLEESGDAAGALSHAFAAARLNPMSPQAVNAAFQRLEPTALKERTFNIACVASFLGQASNRVSDTVAVYRTPTLPKPTRALTEDDFSLGLDVTLSDPELTRLFAQLEPFARLVEMPKPKAQRQLLDSLRTEDVERSTTMLARTFGWTCRLLTLGTPGLFLAESDALPTRLPVEQVGFVVGKSLGRGLSLQELVFIWARSLGMARMQTRVLYTLPSAVRLTQLLQACRSAVEVEQGASSESKQMTKALKKLVPTPAWSALAAPLEALGSSYELRVEQWKQEADRVANRIGLLACGDPELAARTLDRFPLPDGSPKRQQLMDLLTFSLSDHYEELRTRLGLHLG